MKKLYLLKSILLLCALIVGSSAWAETKEFSFLFTNIGATDWSTSYAKHSYEYNEGTVIFNSANKQTSTITDRPVTKGSPVEFVMKEGYTVSAATFTCKQWGSKAQTITLHYSNNYGVSYTTTGVTSSNFTITKNDLPTGTNAVKITFSSSSNQVGISSLSLTYSTSSGVAAPNFSVPSGEFSDAFNLTITGETGSTLKYTIDGSDPADATATESNTATVNIPTATTTVRAIAIKDNVTSDEATATYTYIDPSKIPTFNLSDAELDLKVNEAGEIELTTNSDGTITFVCSDAHVSIDAEDGYAIVSANAAGTYTVNVSVTETANYYAAAGTVTLNVTKSATTLTIDASAIGDTDIYTNTGDNLLDAFVNAGENTVAGATVTWTSSNTDVATISNNGEVTLVAAGSTTITATYAGDDAYEGSSNTYELTVTDTTPYMQPDEVEITLDNSFFGCTKFTSWSNGMETIFTGTLSSVTVTYDKGTSQNAYINDNGIRMYDGNELTFTAPAGFVITIISLEGTSGFSTNLETEDEGLESGTWEGYSSEVTITGNTNRKNMTKATVTLKEVVPVAIGAAGVTTFCSEKALDFTDVDDISVYKAKVVNNAVKLTQIYRVPANTGVILMNAEGMDKGAVASVNVPVLSESADDVSDNELVGVTTATNVAKKSGDNFNYILEAGPVFKMAVEGGATLAAGKAYLSTSYEAPATGARLSIVFDDEAQGISAALNNQETMNNVVFDLQGRRVTNAAKGLYIVDGKKVLVK